jgi:hypothetical protein
MGVSWISSSSLTGDTRSCLTAADGCPVANPTTVIPVINSRIIANHRFGDTDPDLLCLQLASDRPSSDTNRGCRSELPRC